MNEDETVRWEKYVEQCNPSGDPAHSLDAGLMMPIQRIADYPAMCREIQIRGHVRTGVLYEKIGSEYCCFYMINFKERKKMNNERLDFKNLKVNYKAVTLNLTN